MNKENESPALQSLNELFAQCRELQASHNIVAARKLERQVAAIVAAIGAANPNTEEHAEALQTHEYVLLSLSATSKRKSVQEALRAAAYAQGKASVEMKLKYCKPEIGTVFCAHNLAIDLISVSARYAEGRELMVQARTLLARLAGKKKLPTGILMIKLFQLDYGIAKADYHLGDRKSARRILKRSLRYAPPLHSASWSILRNVARTSELLAQIYLDEMDAAD